METKDKILIKSITKGLLIGLISTCVLVVYIIVHINNYNNSITFLFLLLTAIIFKIMVATKFDKRLNYNSYLKYVITYVLSSILSGIIYWTLQYYIVRTFVPEINYGLITGQLIIFISFIVYSIASIFIDVEYSRLYKENTKINRCSIE